MLMSHLNQVINVSHLSGIC